MFFLPFSAAVFAASKSLIQVFVAVAFVTKNQIPHPITVAARILITAISIPFFPFDFFSADTVFSSEEIFSC